MKKFLLFLCGIFLCAVCHSETLDISWYVGDNLYTTTQCNSGGDLILPTPPSKPGYNFVGWRNNFQLVEYLESTGTQYIDTGFVPNNDSGMDIDFYTVRVNASPIAIVDSAVDEFGWGISQQSSDINIKLYVKDGFYASNLWRIDSLYDDGTGRYRGVINGRSVYVITSIGSIVSHVFENSTNTNNLSLWLFGNNRSNPAYAVGVKIYSCKLYDNGTLVRDFVPVIDAAGVPCMWDKVSETFFYNAGTGNFIAGPVVEE